MVKKYFSIDKNKQGSAIMMTRFDNKNKSRNKHKIMNDPVFGFIQIPNELLFDLIEHPILQRLKRIRQLGLTCYVYPGAQHTRFQHVIGAMHLMNEAITVLKSKGHMISEEESTGALVAILLHDIGHGPFSHVLEHTLFNGISHEKISVSLMEKLNSEFDHKLNLAIEIFKGTYHKKFLHQLVSSQLDMDRMDYLRRDSFFAGVSEGTIGSARIIKMLNVKDDMLCVDEKGIYSIEKYLVARRLMYWQVYLHKTAVSAEHLLIKVLTRAKEVTQKGADLFATPALKFFIANDVTPDRFSKTDHAEILKSFIQLDDNDIFSAMKVWAEHDDFILSTLSKNLLNRHLFKTIIQDKPFDKKLVAELREDVMKRFGITKRESSYFIDTETITTNTYNASDDQIKILMKNGETIDIAEASDMLNIKVLSRKTKKHFLWYPQ